MTCTKCGAEVPEGKIACQCFLVAVDDEIEALALKNFAAGARLFLTSSPSSGYHLMPNQRDCLSLCRKKRYHGPETRPIFADEIRKKGLAITSGKKPDWCMDCLMKALQSANAGKPVTVTGAPEERQPQNNRRVQDTSQR
jgi:hypothetical protein